MSKIKEISRRIMNNADEGMACGPVGITAIDAEIVVEDEGRKVYLHAQWIDEIGDEISYEATTESAYDIYEKLNHCSDDEFDDLIAMRDQICSNEIEDTTRYQSFFDELRKMVEEEIKVQGWGYFYFGEDEDEDDA